MIRTLYIKAALSKLDISMDLYRTMMFESEIYKVRMAAGIIADYLSIAVAYINGSFDSEYCKYTAEK